MDAQCFHGGHCRKACIQKPCPISQDSQLPKKAFALFRMGFSKNLSLKKANPAESTITKKISPHREPALHDKGSLPILGMTTHAIPKKMIG
jgi:hypothetical protein